MRKHLPRFIAFAFVLCAAAPFTCLGDEIPKTAWRRPLGQPLDHPGVRKNNVDIDDGYWQGAPVGGFGEWPELGLWVWKTEQTGEPVLHKRKKKVQCRMIWVFPKATRFSPSTSRAGRTRMTGRTSTQNLF